ncbi:hypothetical protein C6A77_21905 [Pseudomonas sp. AFG_SD02_1510_Pfu_092]|nr:hypothetical protein C6A77_21905 [Pseudomonas sp. AFG_SD02_1510_Pfu_092]
MKYSQRFVGAALCRERAAKRPQALGTMADIAGAASQPFRDTRPLPQRKVHSCVTACRPLPRSITARQKARAFRQSLSTIVSFFRASRPAGILDADR